MSRSGLLVCVTRRKGDRTIFNSQQQIRRITFYYTPNGLEVNFFQKRRQESEERLCVRSLAQQSRSGKIGYEKTDIKQT
jgi:hypothetical protein